MGVIRYCSSIFVLSVLLLSVMTLSINGRIHPDSFLLCPGALAHTSRWAIPNLGTLLSYPLCSYTATSGLKAKLKKTKRGNRIPKNCDTTTKGVTTYV